MDASISGLSADRRTPVCLNEHFLPSPLEIPQPAVPPLRCTDRGRTAGADSPESGALCSGVSHVTGLRHAAALRVPETRSRRHRSRRWTDYPSGVPGRWSGDRSVGPQRRVIHHRHRTQGAASGRLGITHPGPPRAGGSRRAKPENLGHVSTDARHHRDRDPSPSSRSPRHSDYPAQSPVRRFERPRSDGHGIRSQGFDDLGIPPVWRRVETPSGVFQNWGICRLEHRLHSHPRRVEIGTGERSQPRPVGAIGRHSCRVGCWQAAALSNPG